MRRPPCGTSPACAGRSPAMIQMSDCASPGARRGLPVPLQPARRIGEAPSSSAKQVVGSWNTSVAICRVGRILRPVILPEPRRLGFQRVHRDEEFQLAQRGADLALVRESLQRIEALADVAVHLALIHHLEGAQDVVVRHVELRQPVIGPVVVGGRGLPVHRLLEADEELPVVLPVAHLARSQRLELLRLHVIVERRFGCPCGKLR